MFIFNIFNSINIFCFEKEKYIFDVRINYEINIVVFDIFLDIKYLNIV